MSNLFQVKPVFFAAVFAFALNACNYIEDPQQGGGATTNGDCPTPVFAPNTNTQRSVLLEEFTGHTCAPCPGGAVEARNLQAYYKTLGKNLVLVNIHAMGLSAPISTSLTDPFNTDFRTASGNYYANDLFIPACPFTPSAFVNRIPYGPYGRYVDKPDWATVVAAEFAKPLEVNVQMQVDYDSLADEGCVHVETEYMTNLSSDYYLVVYLLQDSIVDWQKNNSIGDPAYPIGNVPNYIHQHVFRGCVSPKLGVKVSSGSVVTGTKFINSISFSLNKLADTEGIVPKPTGHAPQWIRKHFIFVAYVYDATTKEILQVTEKHLVE